MKHPFQLIIFDCDGTLVDSLGNISRVANLAVTKLGLAKKFETSAIASVVGLSLEEAFTELLPQTPATDILRAVTLYKGIYQQLADEGELPDPLFPGVLETLTRIRDAGLILAMATGKSTRGLLRTLREHQLEAWFQILMTSDCAHSKPNPDMLLQILHKTGVPPNQALMVGDTDFDIQMGQAAGTKTCAVTFGCHPKDRLQRARPDYWLDHFFQLPEIIGLSP